MKRIPGLTLTIVVCIALIWLILPAGCATPTQNAPATAPAKAGGAARPEVQIDMLTAQSGVTAYTIGLAHGSIAKKYHPWLRLTASETPGFVYNMEFLDENPGKWKDTIGAISEKLVYMASKGMDPFKKQTSGWRYLLVNTQSIQCFVTYDAKIRTMNDLVGKKLALGQKTQIEHGVAPVFIMGPNGLDIMSKIKVEYVGTKAGSNALTDGLVAGTSALYTGSLQTNEWEPAPFVLELMGTGKPLYPIDYTRAPLDKLVKLGYPMAPAVVPAGKISKDQNYEFTALMCGAYWACKDVFPEDVAYEFVKMALDHHKEYGGFFSACKFYTPQFLAYGLTKENAHPGAVRAFSEAKVNIPDK